jgi:hypothetical protein
MAKKYKPKHAKPGKPAGGMRASEVAKYLIGAKYDLDKFVKREAIKPMDEIYGRRLQSEQGHTVHGVDNPGKFGPHVTQPWLATNGPGRRGVITEKSVREELAAAEEAGYDPSSAITSPPDRGEHPDRVVDHRV